MNKKSIAVILGFSLLVTIMLFGSVFVQASFVKGNAGNASDAILSRYAPGDNIKGWINLSFTDEPFNSQLIFSYPSSAKTSDFAITIKELLDKNKLNTPQDYSCTTSDCGAAYTAEGAGSDSQTFTLNSGASKLVGMLITAGSIDTISELKLNITSNAVENCLNPLQIDIGDDGIIDWYANSAKLNSNCSGENYGCYVPSGTSTTKIISNVDYCETITLTPTPAIMVGADITGTGNAAFTFTVSDGINEDKYCSVTASGSGKITCPNSINLSIYSTESTNVQVCIRKTSGEDYYLSYEQNAPCGSDSADYSIFAKQLKYNSVGNIVVNTAIPSETNLGYSFAETAENYIYSKYENICTNGCYIPIRIISGVNNQEIRINNAKLSYQIGSLSPEVTTIYNLVSIFSKINMPFKKITFDNLGVVAPEVIGFHNLAIKLDSTAILTKKIEVLNVPIIGDIRPVNAPAGGDITFFASVSGLNISSYKWNFGDNSSVIETKTPYATHMYSSIGTYTLLLTAKNAKGEQSKSFTIKTISPKDYLNASLIYYKNEIKLLKSQMESLPLLVKTYLEGSLNLTATETKIATLQASFNSVGSDTLKQIAILKDLSTINLPESINFSEKSTGKFAFDSSIVNSADIIGVTKEQVSGNDGQIKNAVASWFSNNIDATLDLRVYYLYYSNFSEPVVSYVNIKLTPKQSSNMVYAIISKPQANVFVTQSNAVYLSNAVGFPLDLSTGEKSAEFLIVDKVSFLNLPVYFSPSITQLALISEIDVCNFNGKCESDSGEDSKNCAKDCKPWGKAFLWILFVLILALCAYIGAQEWYKKYYEDYLFKDKNDLFNLVNFIDNAEKQGLKKEEMFLKLKEKIWPNEQIEYAYNKYKGLRTGMWEIPIFKFIENKKVALEIQKRQKLGVNPNIVPNPIRPFVRRQQMSSQVPKTPAQLAMQAQKSIVTQPNKPNQSNQTPATTSVKPANSNTQKNTGEQKKNN